MKKANYIFLAFLLSLCSLNKVQAAGLDEIYRDLVRSDNRGYLPLFVKNREAPKIFSDENFAKEVTRPEVIDEQAVRGLEDINLENDRQRRSAEIEAAQLRWEQVLKNVQNGYVSSFELDELVKHEQQDDPKAVEVLAWIYSRGIGVKTDLLKAFSYYKKAVALNIPNAKENAIKVYHAMSPDERAQLLE